MGESKIKLIILVGESACGKDYIKPKLIDKMCFENIKTNTTRKPRYFGENGYNFSTEEEYETQMNEGEVVESAIFHGNRYWTTNSMFEGRCTKVIILEPSGVRVYKKKFAEEAVVIYLKATERTRKMRMIKRVMGKTLAQKLITLLNVPKLFRIIKEANNRIRNDIEVFKDIKYDYIVDSNGDSDTLSEIISLLSYKR